MPEGDTIHRIANRLRPILVGQPVHRLDAPRATGKRPNDNSTITKVNAVGKHLLIGFDDGTVLRTHLGMTGSWHLYRTGEMWRKPGHLARAVVDVDGWTAVCFAAPTVVFEHEQTMTSLDSLGPDLTNPEITDTEIESATERMRIIAEPNKEIADVLLDQRVASGIGNVYKSEVLWACGVGPFTPVAALDTNARRQLMTTASKLLRANVVNGSRGLAVYGRAGQPCRRCGGPIRARRQGEHARTTYWCPTCQSS